ncbi:MAG: glycosyltransferase family 39 protein [Acidobacteria bacterium]|nr:glycosyltransferase family 39 protein [Acidobacteriota bacterium]
MGEPPNGTAPAGHRAAVVGLLALTAALLVSSSRHKPLSHDEPPNLRYGHRFLAEGPHVPTRGQRMPVLALNALGCLSSGCAPGVVDASDGRRLAVRAATMGFAVLLAWAVYAWARELYGPPGALLALALCALNPNVLAHGKQVTSDVAASLFTLASTYALGRFLRNGGLAWLIAAAALTAGALASKFTSLLLLPLFAIACAAHGLRSREHGRRAVMRGAAKVLVFATVVLLLLNAVYLFDGTLRPALHREWRSGLLAPLADSGLPLALPAAFLDGLDRSMLIQESSPLGAARGMNYALGRRDWDRIPYAFPLMLLLKTPLALFPLLALAARTPSHRVAEELLLLWLPSAVFFLFFTFWVVPQLGVRYLLPAIPFLFVYAGRSLAGSVSPWRAKAVTALVAWYAASSLSYHPHFMSYFNELIGPRVNAYRFLADSNLDWEDRTHFLEEFRREHPETPFAFEPAGPQAGWVMVRVNSLVGIAGDPERYRWLRRHFRPVRHVAYSYLLFDVPPESLGRRQSEPPP